MTFGVKKRTRTDSLDFLNLPKTNGFDTEQMVPCIARRLWHDEHFNSLPSRLHAAVVVDLLHTTMSCFATSPKSNHGSVERPPIVGHVAWVQSITPIVPQSRVVPITHQPVGIGRSGGEPSRTGLYTCSHRSFKK
jgi:hypothetical protein